MSSQVKPLLPRGEGEGGTLSQDLYYAIRKVMKEK